MKFPRRSLSLQSYAPRNYTVSEYRPCPSEENALTQSWHSFLNLQNNLVNNVLSILYMSYLYILCYGIEGGAVGVIMYEGRARDSNTVLGVAECCIVY